MTTRYPKKGKGSKWTALEVKAIPAAWAGDKLSEENLVGEVRVSQAGEVAVKWTTSYRWEGKLKWFYCGTSPHDSLEDIRAQRDWCKEQVKAGVNPGDRKRLDKIEAQAAVEAALAAEEARKQADRPTVDMIEDWLSRGVRRDDGNVELRRILWKDVVPAIGAIPLRLLGEQPLAACVKAVVDRGSPRMAVIVYANLVQCFTWANKRQPWRNLMQQSPQGGNPMEVVELDPLLPPGYDKDNICERVLSEEEVRTLDRTLKDQRESWESAKDRRRHPQPLEVTSELALWICLSTLCRVGELTKTEWAHVNFITREWFIPKENQKATRGKAQDHTVYLSDFALEKFRALQALTGHTRWVFPSINHPSTHRCVKTLTKQVGDRQARFKTGKKLRGRRYDDTLVIGAEAWTPHDLRRTGATMMQSLGVLPGVIDRCQNHVMDGSKVRRHYMHYDYAAEKREAWERLGRHLERVLRGAPILRLVA